MISRNIIHQLFIFLTIGAFFSCANNAVKNHSDEELDGGPCTYDSYSVAAVITEIVRLEEEQVDLKFCLLPDTSKIKTTEVLIPDNRSDTLLFSETNRQYLSVKEFKQLAFQPGDSLTYTFYTIKEGACSPHYDLLELIKYSIHQK